LLGVNAQQAALAVQLVSLGSLACISLGIYAAIVIATAPLVALSFALVGGLMAFAFSPLRARVRATARAHAAGVGDLQLAATSYAQLNRELHVYGVGAAAAKKLDDESRGV